MFKIAKWAIFIGTQCSSDDNCYVSHDDGGGNSSGNSKSRGKS